MCETNISLLAETLENDHSFLGYTEIDPILVEIMGEICERFEKHNLNNIQNIRLRLRENRKRIDPDKFKPNLARIMKSGRRIIITVFNHAFNLQFDMRLEYEPCKWCSKLRPIGNKDLHYHTDLCPYRCMAEVMMN